MCGIAGSINIQADEQTILNSLKHRGPDYAGSFHAFNVALFHTRLSIQDLSASAHQPMQNQRYAIIFNGEIYNHLTLRSKVPDYHFQTSSDTESILALFEAYGVDMLKEFDGMFAFVLLDKKEQKIFFVRDRMGKKPLFIYCNKQQLAFASELNTLMLFAPLEIDMESIELFLQFGFFPDDMTPYHFVFPVPAAHYGVVDINNLKDISFAPYFDFLSLYYQPKITQYQEAYTKVEESLNICIKRRLESSDVEVGSFLSGGIDSSLIVAIASQYHHALQTFTVSFEGGYDESSLSALVAQKYSTHHNVLHINMDTLAQDIENILIAYGRPFMDSSSIPSYYVSKEAKKYLNVVLNGDGADELFAGYRRYMPFAYNIIKYIKILAPLLPYLPKPHIQKSYYNYFYRLLSMSSKKGIALYTSATIDAFDDFYAFKQTALKDKFFNFIQNTFNNPKLSPLSAMLYLDSQFLLLSDLLPKMDIATMQHALEARSPFLGLEVLQVATALDDCFKIKGKKSKYILRALAEKYLPNELVNAPKRGFEVPLSHWVNYELKEIIEQKICDTAFLNEFITKDFIYSLLKQPHLFPAQKRAKMIFCLFSLSVWYHHYKESCL